MSRRILFTGVNSGLSKMLENDAELPSIAKKLGHQLCSDLDQRPDVVICIDYDRKFKNLLVTARGLGVPLVLVKQEPPVVNPTHLNENPAGLFDLVISRAKADQKPTFPPAQIWDTTHIAKSTRLKRIVAISADKWSFIPGELYSLRRLMYATHSRITLYGRSWTDSNWTRFRRLLKELVIAASHGVVPKLANMRLAFKIPLNFQGVADNKLEVLSRYHAALVIENDATSLSEKLMDCILAGTIPVYVGPPTESFGIPNDLVVSCEPDASSISTALDLALERNSKEYRAKVWAWASQDSSRSAWSDESVGTTLLDYIVDKTSQGHGANG